jgi:hypothetical protein
VGQGAATGLSSGANCVFIGSGAGNANVTGSGNIAIGAGANFTTGALTNAVVIGTGCTAALSNTIVLGNSSINTTVVGSATVGASAAPTSTLDVQGSTARKVTAVTSAVTLDNTHSVVKADASGGAFAVTLPSASSCPGREYRIFKSDASANAVTVTRAGSDTINGANTFPLGTQYKFVVVQSDGNSLWMVFGFN